MCMPRGWMVNAGPLNRKSDIIKGGTIFGVLESLEGESTSLRQPSIYASGGICGCIEVSEQLMQE